MELDRVRRDAGLSVLVVEEGHADDTSPSAHPRDPARGDICLRRADVAPVVQRAEGVSAIIVREPLR